MRLRITLLLLCVIAGIGFTSRAEGLWGVKASLDFNKPGRWNVGDASFKMYNSGLGFSAGGVYTHYFNDNFFLEPSLSIFYDTYSCDLTIPAEEGIDAIDPTVYKVGVRLPVVFGYTFDITDDFSICVFTGPELNYAFGGGYRLKDKAFKDEIGSLFGTEVGKPSGMQRRVSASWKGGIGFPFSDWRVDVEAAVGMTDMIQGPASCKENRISISLLRYF